MENDAKLSTEFVSLHRVHRDDGSSYIEPPLDQSWPDLDKLQWNAAVIEQDTGLRLEPRQTGRRRFAVMAPGTGYGSSIYTYGEAWNWMIALSMGAKMYAAQQRSRDGKL